MDLNLQCGVHVFQSDGADMMWSVERVSTILNYWKSQPKHAMIAEDAGHT